MYSFEITKKITHYPSGVKVFRVMEDISGAVNTKIGTGRSHHVSAVNIFGVSPENVGRQRNLILKLNMASPLRRPEIRSDDDTFYLVSFLSTLRSPRRMVKPCVSKYSRRGIRYLRVKPVISLNWGVVNSFVS